MGCFSGPEIVTNGLVFSYDQGNTPKSWRGAPTTNLTPDMQLTGMGFGLTFTYVGLENGWKKYSIDGTWNGGTYPYSFHITGVSFTGGVTYSTGVFIKTNVPGKFVTLFTGMNYVNEPMNNAGTSFSIAQPDGSFFVGRTGFQYTSTTTQTGYLLSRPTTTPFVAATDFVYIKDGQVETGSFTTPFTSGTRSSTQALLDLTGRNTINATSLSYTSNGAFSFNGSGNFVEVTNNDGFGEASTTPTITMEMWANVARKAGGGTQFQQLAGFRNDTNFDFFFLLLDSSGSTVNTEARLRTASGNYDIGVDYTTYFNTWAHIAFVANVNRSDLYINGILVGSNTLVAGSFGSTSGNFRVGLAQSGAFATNGRLDSVKVYSRALTGAEVLQNFNANRGRFGL